MRAFAKIRQPQAPLFRPAPTRKVVFRVFRDDCGHWRVTSDDGMCGGTFFEREPAIRFARRESGSFPVLESPRKPPHSRRPRIRAGILTVRVQQAIIAPYLNAGVIVLAIGYAVWLQHDQPAAPPEAKPAPSIGHHVERWDEASTLEWSALLTI